VDTDINFNNIEVSGHATIKSLDVTSDADVTGNLNIGGNFVALTKPASFKDINVGGMAVIKSLNTTTGSISNLNVIGNASVSKNLIVDGTFAPADSKFEDIEVSGIATIGSLSTTSATIDGVATIQTLNVITNAVIQGDLNIEGMFAPANSEFENLKVTGTATVGSLLATTASIDDTANIQTLNVFSDADIQGDLNVEGTFAPANSEFENLSVTGTAIVGSLSATSVSIDDVASIQTLNVISNADIDGDLSVNGNFVSVNSEFQDITISGTASVGSLLATTASIDDTANIQILNVDSNLDVSGDLTVGGIIINDEE